jgi:hypothetical protein
VPQEQLATQIDSDVLATVRNLAAEEGRKIDTLVEKIDTLVEEALRDLIRKHQHPAPRLDVIATYMGSHERFAALYKKLAE